MRRVLGSISTDSSTDYEKVFYRYANRFVFAFGMRVLDEHGSTTQCLEQMAEVEVCQKLLRKHLASDLGLISISKEGVFHQC